MTKNYIDIIPAKGYILAYLKQDLIFEPYEVKHGKLCFKGSERLKCEQPSECHFFDRESDYRIVVRESRGDVREALMTEEEERYMDSDLLFIEEALIKEEYAQKEGFPKKLRVINRYRYSDNDTLVLYNYRISFV